MNINVHVSGVVEKVIEKMIKQGYAASKTEAIRLSLLNFAEEHELLKEKSVEGLEDELDFAVAQKFEKELKSGKAKLKGEKELKKLLK